MSLAIEPVPVLSRLMRCNWDPCTQSGMSLEAPPVGVKDSTVPDVVYVPACVTVGFCCVTAQAQLSPAIRQDVSTIPVAGSIIARRSASTSAHPRVTRHSFGTSNCTRAENVVLPEYVPSALNVLETLAQSDVKSTICTDVPAGHSPPSSLM